MVNIINDKILNALGVDSVPRVLVGNKTDLIYDRYSIHYFVLVDNRPEWLQQKKDRPWLRNGVASFTKPPQGTTKISVKSSRPSKIRAHTLRQNIYRPSRRNSKRNGTNGTSKSNGRRRHLRYHVTEIPNCCLSSCLKRLSIQFPVWIHLILSSVDSKKWNTLTKIWMVKSVKKHKSV